MRDDRGDPQLAPTIQHVERRESFAAWLARRFPRGDIEALNDPTHPANSGLVGLYTREVAFDDDVDGPAPVDLSVVGTVPAPPREWIVHEWAATCASILLASHGGVGKSLLSAQLAVCIAAGLPFFGLPVRRSRVMLLSTEDSRDELHRRLQAVAVHLGADLVDLASGGWLHVYDATARDVAIFGREVSISADGRPFVAPEAAATKWYAWLRDECERNEVAVLILDSLSDLFDGDEVRRREVRRFIRLATALITPRRGCVFIVGHVNRPDATNGRGAQFYSGSTAWHNSVRQRWALYRDTTDGDDGEEGGDQDDGRRILELQKTNYGQPGARVELRYDTDRHVLIGTANAAAGDLITAIQDRADRRAILRALAAAEDAGDPVHSGERAHRNASVILKAAGELPRRYRGRAGKPALFRLLLKLKAEGLLAEDSVRSAARHPVSVWRVTPAGRNESAP